MRTVIRYQVSHLDESGRPMESKVWGDGDHRYVIRPYEQDTRVAIHEVGDTDALGDIQWRPATSYPSPLVMAEIMIRLLDRQHDNHPVTKDDVRVIDLGTVKIPFVP